jgi:hypothetical protein
MLNDATDCCIEDIRIKTHIQKGLTRCKDWIFELTLSAARKNHRSIVYYITNPTIIDHSRYELFSVDHPHLLWILKFNHLASNILSVHVCFFTYITSQLNRFPNGIYICTDFRNFATFNPNLYPHADPINRNIKRVDFKEHCRDISQTPNTTKSPSQRIMKLFSSSEFRESAEHNRDDITTQQYNDCQTMFLNLKQVIIEIYQYPFLMHDFNLDAITTRTFGRLDITYGPIIKETLNSRVFQAVPESWVSCLDVCLDEVNGYLRQRLESEEEEEREKKERRARG